MLASAVRSQALRAMRTPAVRRGMCTAVEEPLHPMSLKKPMNQIFAMSTAALYIGTLRWQSIDRKMAKEAAEKAAAHKEEAHETAASEADVMQTKAEPTTAAPAAPGVAAITIAPAPTASVTAWKTDDVSAWLSSIELPMHADAFKAHSVDGTMLLVLTEEDLYKSLGVASPLHRKKLMLGIGELRKGFLGMK